jgi:RNA-directed DNA polymerase
MSNEMAAPRSPARRTQFLEKWVERAKEVAGNPALSLADIGDEAVDVIASVENLKLAWDHMAKFGGEAAGPNRKSFRHYSRVQSWSEIERLHKTLELGSYRHGEVREASMPKRPSGTGTRPLAIPDTHDRVVGRAEVQIIEPLFQPRFDDRSFCRSGRGPWPALAAAKRIAEEENRWLWISEDIQGAFDNVPLGRLFEVFFAAIPSSRLLDLIRRSVDDQRAKALWQGAPLSPLLMNVYLDVVVDRPWRRLHPDVPLLRYMDDLLILCCADDDAETLHRDLSNFVEGAGLQLKYRFDAAHHLIEQRPVTWLGYRIRKLPEELEIRLPFDGMSETAKSWRRYLRERFVALHAEPDAPAAARNLIKGILAWAGPTFPWTDKRAAYDVLRKAARFAAFEEIASYSCVLRQWQAHHERWLDVISEARDSGVQQTHPADLPR